MLLRLVELIVCLVFVAWTVVFPLATLLSLLVALPVLALLVAPPAPARRPACRPGRRLARLLRA